MKNLEIQLSNKLEPLWKLFREVHNITCHYVEAHNYEDCPYFYNERAIISLMSGAAWRMGFYALEEYSSSKKHEENDYSGRVDLYISSDEKSFVFESKIHWENVSTKYSLDNANKTFQKAVSDTQKIDREEADLRVAVLFVIPYYPEHFKNSGIGNVNEYGLLLKNNLKLDGIISIFPDCCRGLNGGNGYYYPGFFMLLKIVA